LPQEYGLTPAKATGAHSWRHPLACPPPRALTGFTDSFRVTQQRAKADPRHTLEGGFQ
jgi:hypothetical protein